MNFDSLPDIVTIQQLADYLQVSYQTVTRAIKKGELEAFKVADVWRIEKQSVIKWLEDKKNK